jgi:hypothetical protein
MLDIVGALFAATVTVNEVLALFAVPGPESETVNVIVALPS